VIMCTCGGEPKIVRHYNLNDSQQNHINHEREAC